MKWYFDNYLSKTRHKVKRNYWAFNLVIHFTNTPAQPYCIRHCAKCWGYGRT